MRHLSFIYATFILSTVAATNSFGSPITFTYTGSGSGTIGGSVFPVSAFTITAIGDTDTRIGAPSDFLYKIAHSSASITITGVGSFNFVTGTQTFFNDVNHTPGLQHSSPFGSDLFDGPSAQTLAGWDMLTSVGPVFGSMMLIQWNTLPVITSGGQLIFSDTITSGSFSALVASPSAVPDNSHTVFLFCCVLLGVIGLRRTSFRSKT
jgi:hypothetical protein